MPSYKNLELVAVSALVIPVGSIVDAHETWSGVLVYNDDGKDHLETVSGDYVDDGSDAVEEFLPPDKWYFNHTGGDQGNKWFKAIEDCVVLDINAFGNGFGTVSCGIDFEITQTGLIDAFQEEDFKQLADLAKSKLAAYKLTPEYRLRRRYGQDEPIKPLDFEDNQVNMVLVYRYTSVIDDYNHECDVYIEFQGELEMEMLDTILVGSDEAR
jgi:hypothetical protein